MRSRYRIVAAVAIIIAVMFCMSAVLRLGRGHAPPVVSVDLLGYTNRIGPYALVAITNRSDAPIKLDPQCVLGYGKTPEGLAPRVVTSFEPHTLRVTRLGPHGGFTQEVFVFPASRSQWQFECYTSYSSLWSETRRSLEKWVHKHIRRAKYPLRSKLWHRNQSKLFACPP
jgi:hypothetical protein